MERCFDDLKNLLKLRPVYHQTDRRTKGALMLSLQALKKHSEYHRA
ncbi:MAG: hypothetical protein PVF58_18355 [Candidatus Methanofastidiosia archaeon]